LKVQKIDPAIDGGSWPTFAVRSPIDAVDQVSDDSSNMLDIADAGLDARIAARVREHRAARGLSLQALAARSGVSRSMISLIERGESSATAVLLDKLAAAFGVPLASLFDAPPVDPSPVSRGAVQPTWRDPASGYLRRNLSPPGVASPIHLVEIEFPAGARVSYDSVPRDPPLHQQVWVLDGRIDVTVGDVVHRLEAGDCLAFVLDLPISYRNPGRRAARYAVAMAAGPARRS
jgi:transcriptional regulator with XRE-family HTH domain